MALAVVAQKVRKQPWRLGGAGVAAVGEPHNKEQTMKKFVHVVEEATNKPIAIMHDLGNRDVLVTTRTKDGSRNSTTSARAQDGSIVVVEGSFTAGDRIVIIG